MNLETWLIPLLTVAGSGLSAFASVKATLNGTREDVREIKGDVKEIRKEQADVRERVAKLEGAQ